MGAESSDAAEVEKLYEFGDRLNEAKDKTQNVSAYEGIITAVKGGSVKAKQLAAQLIPRFFKFFPGLAALALTAQFDLVEEDELGAKRGATAYANGSGNSTKKCRGDGPVQNQLMNRALEGFSRGGGGGGGGGREEGFGRSRKR